MFKFWNRTDNRRRETSPRVIRQQIITPTDLKNLNGNSGPELRDEVRRVIESQPAAGRYRVRVRRKNIHL